jgi:hypothetical protein
LDKRLLEEKLMIVRLLQQKGIFGERKIGAIMLFLKNYVRFAKPQMNRSFEERTDKLTGKKNTMGIYEYFAEEARRETLEKTSKRFVENLLKNSDFSQTKIASLANVSLAFVRKVKKGLSTK